MFSIKKFTSFIVLALFGFSMSAYADKKDCVDCKFDKVSGEPAVGNLDKLARFTNTGLYQNTDFEGYHQTYCLKFEDVGHTYAFKKEILESMKKTPYGVDKYWVQSGCHPKKMGNTVSPIAHLVAEDASGRTQFLESLYKYYADKKDLKTFTQVLNAKNSRGLTMLDYIVYLENNNQFNKNEREEVNSLIKFICDKGGKFSVSSEKKCPMSI